MEDGPIERERSRLDAAHRRRAQLIAQIHRQAITAANADRMVQQMADSAKYSRWRKADRIIVTAALKIIAVGAFIALFGCILALWGR
jgi:hypothetical protein